MAGEVVQVSIESSWTVLKGSLESCVSVVFLDPDTHEPIIPSFPHSSTKLVLVPPAEPAPCEITVKFHGSLCHVQSLYTSSTARICEIYSRSNHETDQEYVCTVKGWNLCKDDFSSDNGSVKNLEDAAAQREDEVLVKGLDCSNDKGLISSGVSSMPVSNHDVDDECQKSVYSSGEDSWVSVKLNGSLSAESACVSLMAPDLDNWHVPLNVEELVHLEDQLGMASQGLQAEKRGLENAVTLSDSSCEGKAPIEQVGQGSACLEMFEAEVELVDHNPWAAITIRLLSLQDKTVVELDQMVFIALSGPVPEPAASSRRSDGREPTSALFAMFLPSIIHTARGISDNSKDLPKSEKSNQPCEEKQDLMGDSLVGKEASHQCAVLEEVPVLKNTTPCPPSVHNVVESASSKTNNSTELEGDNSSLLELDADGNVLKGTVEPGDQTLPMCNCKELVVDVINKELATTFQAFSERFDKLESLCLRLESFLQKTFECLDQRIGRLEVQHTKDSGETDSTNKHLHTLSDVSIMQSHQNDYARASQSKEKISSSLPESAVQGHSAVQQDSSSLPESAVQGHSAMQHQNSNQIHAKASLLDQTEAEEEVSFRSMELDHCEMQHVVNEASLVNIVDSNSTDIENLVNEASSDIQELSREPEVTVFNTVSKDKLPHVSLDDAWASALSAFASSCPSILSVSENNVTGIVNKQSLGSVHNDDSVSRAHYFKEVGNGSSPSSYSDVTVIINDVDNKGVNTGHGPTHGVHKEATCHEQMQEVWGILPPSHSMMNKPVMTFDFLAALNDVRGIPNQKLAAGIECGRSVESVEEQGILLPSHSEALDPDNVFDLLLSNKVESNPDELDVASSEVLSQQEAQHSSLQFGLFSSAHTKSMPMSETLDDWGVLGDVKTHLLPVLQSSSEVNQDANLRFPFYMCNTGGGNQEMVNFNLSGGNGEHSFLQEIVASDTLTMWQRSFTSHAERSEEESLRNASLERDFLSGHILSERGEGSSIAEAQDPESFKRSFMYCTTEDAGSFPDLLDDSSNYQDGRTCSQDSLCFSQDFETCPNESSDTRWSCAPNVFYMHDPELTDDEADNTTRALDDRTDSSASILQDDFSDTESTRDLPFWPALHSRSEDEHLTIGFDFLDTESTQDLPFCPALHSRSKDEQPTITVFPGFENLC